MGLHTRTPTSGEVLSKAVVGQRRAVAIGSVLGISHQAGEAMVPVLIGVTIDRAVATGAVDELIWWIAVLAVVFVVLSYSFRFAARAAERAAEQAAHEIRVSLTSRVLDPRGGAETGRLSGAMVMIATEDAKRVGAVN
ncbi:MAG: ABC transporter ATP-binding protein, partial [Pseudonocardiaceae bacterium]